MIYTVTCNPSLDYIVDVEHFVPGKVNRSTKESIYPGGKGINVSIVLKNLGFDNTALGFLAGFTGEQIKNSLADIGVSTDFIEVEKGISRINVKLRSDEESEINGTGPAFTDTHIKKLYEKLDKLSDGDILILSGSIPSQMPETLYSDICEYLKEKNVMIVVDATKDLLMNVLKSHPFLIKPNNHELGEIYGVTLKTREKVIPYAKKLQEEGAQNVLISMAGEGAVLIAKDGSVYQSEAPKGTLVNSVGAGDSMVAGFVAGYLMSDGNYGEAFKYGVSTGSASAFTEWLASREQVEKLKEGVMLI
ncbi:MAG: 1-phosphofructokinase [Eubacterium sp.]|nr:1-phosphofructokinase [Eubacterium sp.]